MFLFCFPFLVLKQFQAEKKKVSYFKETKFSNEINYSILVTVLWNSPKDILFPNYFSKFSAVQVTVSVPEEPPQKL
jgi:hypothetical protein